MQIPPALRQRRFALFWVGLLFAWTGNQILTWLIPWQIHDFTDNPAALANIGLIRLGPTLIFSLLAGMIADQFNRRKIMIITQSVMGLSALTLGLLTWAGVIQIWHVYTVLVVHATAFAIDLPARFGLTPNLVSRKLLPNALSVEIIAFQIGGVFGPLLNGLIIDKFDVHVAYFTSAALFAVMSISLLVMGSVTQETLQRKKIGVDWPGIKEGILFTFTHPLILSAMLLDFFATLFTRADSLLTYFARDILGVQGFAYGVLTAAPMIGAVLAGLIISQIREIRQQGKLVLGAVTMIGASAIIFGFSHTYWLSVFALMLAGASDSVSSILRNAIRQLHTPDRLRGRMISVNQIFFMGGPYLGDVKSGYLGKLIGVPLAVALGGFACIFSVGLINRRWPQMRAFDGEG